MQNIFILVLGASIVFGLYKMDTILRNQPPECTTYFNIICVLVFIGACFIGGVYSGAIYF